VDTMVDVPDNKRGTVIGSKGANIRILQEKLGVKINFPEKGSEDGVSIVGDSAAVSQCAAAIREIMAQGYSSITHEGFVKISMEVNRDMISKILGRQGDTIRGLQKNTGTKIDIPSDKSGETVVITILGDADSVANCRTQVEALLVPPEPTPIAPEWTQAATLQHVDLW